LPTLEQPTADTAYAKGYPSGVLDVLIVGAEFSGLGMAIKLLQLSYDLSALNAHDSYRIESERHRESVNEPR
jgi:monoamine oxidase